MEVFPFRGIRYSPSRVGDLGRVLCPPYDVITEEQRKLYYQRSLYNAIRLELPAESQQPAGDRYQVAAITFRQWLKGGILAIDEIPGFYLHDHYFEYLGEKKIRRGLIARVRLRPWGDGIYPHEPTFSKVKSDRLQLMRACRANFSPLLCLYQDSSGEVASILSGASRAEPLIEASVPSLSGEEGEEAHILWAIRDVEISRKLSDLLSTQPLYIADGHHRYETALAYQAERAQGEPDNQSAATGSFQYTMMELVEFSDPGLVVLPIHRLVSGIPPMVLAGLEERLRKLFVLESIPFEASNWRLPADAYFGVLGLQAGSLVLLKRRQDVSLDGLMPDDRSRVYREFSVSVLNHVVLDKLLGLTSRESVNYTVNIKEAYEQVEKGKYQLAFLLDHPQPGLVKAVADARDRMPSKSTYFYPKIPAGLVINPLD